MRRMTALALIIGLTVPTSALAQELEVTETISMDGEQAWVVRHAGEEVVLVAPGARINYPRSTQRTRWYMLQDSTLGAAFTEPSGLKATNEGNFDGDLDVQFLESIQAIEFKSLVFDAWNDYVGTYRYTCVCTFETGEEEGFNPVWHDFEGKSDEIWATITYVSRVRLRDGTIKNADTEPIHQVAKSIDSEFQSADEAIQSLRDLFRELIRRMGTPGAGLTLNSIDGGFEKTDEGR